MNQGSYDLRRDVDKLKNKTDELAKDIYVQVNSPIVTYKDEVYTPSTIVANAYQSSREITDFYDDGILDIWESRNGGNTYTPLKQTTNHTISAVINDTTITNYRVNLYDDKSNLIDWQTITIVRTTKGGAGQGYDFIYYTTEKESLSQSDYPTGDITKLVGNFNEWLQSPKAIDNLHPNVFMSYRTSDGEGVWGNWSTPVKYNARGERGEDGEGLEMIFCRTQYADGYSLDPSTLDPVQDPDYVPNLPNLTEWSDDQKGVSSTYCFEYVCMRTKEVPTGSKEARWGKFSPPKLWATFSEDGKDGKGIELIFRTTTTDDAPSFVTDQYGNQGSKNYTGTINGKKFTDDDYVPQNWTDDQNGVDETNQYEWVAKRIKKVTNGVASWESFNTPQLWASFSEDGEDAITVMLGNEAQLIPIDSNKALKDNPTVIDIPVYCYKGIERTAGTISLSGVSSTFSNKQVVQNPTASADGLVRLTCSTVPAQITKNEQIKVTVGGQTITKYFTWHKIGDGSDGNDGGTFDFVYYTTSSSTPPSKPSSKDAYINPNIGADNYNSWCARPSTQAMSVPYCYGSYIKKVNGELVGSYSDVFLWSNYGSRGSGAVNVTTAPYSYTTQVDGFTPSYRINLQTAKDESGLSDIMVGDYIRYSYYVYPIGLIKGSFAYLSDRISIRGESGKAVASVENQYASGTSNTTPPSSGWQTVVTQVTTFNTTNKYLWNKEVSKDIDGNVISESSPHVIAEYGTNGGVSSVIEQYALSGNTTAPTSGWGENIPPMTSTNKYLWNREWITYINNVKYTSPAKIIGVYGDTGLNGEDGADGEGLEMVFCRTNTIDGYPSDPSTLPDSVINSDAYQQPDYLPTGWYDDQIGVNASNPYEYVCMRTKIPDPTDSSGKTLKWGPFNEPSLWSNYSYDGDKIYEIQNEPSPFNNASYPDYKWQKTSQSIINESTATELFVGDILKWETYLYQIAWIGSQSGNCITTERTQLRGIDGVSPDPADIVNQVGHAIRDKNIDIGDVDASTLEGNSASSFMSAIPSLATIQQEDVGSGTVECRKFGQLVVVNVNQCTINNTASSQTGWEAMRKTNSSWLVIPSEYQPSTDIIVGAGTNSANSNDAQLRIINTSHSTNAGKIFFKRSGYISATNYGEIVSATFVYFRDSRTATTITATNSVDTDMYPGDSINITLKSGNTPLANKTINVRINNMNYPKTTDTNGQTSIKLNLPARISGDTHDYHDYSYNIRFNGDETYAPSSTGGTVRLNYAPPLISDTLPTSEDGQSKTVTRSTPFTGYVKNQNRVGILGIEVVVSYAGTSKTYSGKTDNDGRFEIYHPNDNHTYGNNSTLFSTKYTVPANTLTKTNQLNISPSPHYYGN